MKKYSVFSLYVVKKGDYYFICKKGNEPNLYIEFFTKEKIIPNKEEVKNLSDYYSLLGILDYKTGKVLYLNKKQIRLKYLEINKNHLLKKGMDLMIDYWQDYVESVKNDMPKIPIINAKELKMINKK